MKQIIDFVWDEFVIAPKVAKPCLQVLPYRQQEKDETPLPHIADTDRRKLVWLVPLGSLEWDTLAAPSVVMAALAGFVISVLPLPRRCYGCRDNKS